MTLHKQDCIICGSTLEYHSTGKIYSCYYCGKDEVSPVSCVKGHFICDECHSAPAGQIIFDYCLQSPLTDPIQIANNLFHHPSVKMHGPEHHFLVPAVLITSYCNNTNNSHKKNQLLLEASTRSKKVPGGFCGYYGTCGSAIGVGMFFSLITSANPLSTLSWKLANKATSKALHLIAENGGPRCCKRCSWLAISEAAKIINDEFKLEIGVTESPHCEFSHLNKECKKVSCQFY